MTEKSNSKLKSYLYTLASALILSTAFAVFMGVFYGRAKLCENWGDGVGCRANLWAGYLLAVALHGFYDACAMIGSGFSTALFVTFVIAMYFIVIRVIRKESRTDHPV